MRVITTFISAAALCFALPVSADAKLGMANEEEINAGLLTAAIAEKIQRECDSIGGRLIRGQAYLNRLKDMAVERGYSDAEIETYINDDVEKAKMRERRNAYFQSQGASNLDPDSLCVLGHQEITKNSQIGRLLRAK